MNSLYKLITFLILFTVVQPVHALEETSFPSCVNPQATLKVSYETGNHAIVGEQTLRQGSDHVYTLGSGDYLQCFCPEDGTGIKTSWMQISELSDPDINAYIKQGWIFVSDGKGWGLESSAYLAKNEVYSCLSSVTTTPTPTSKPGTSSTSGGVGGQITQEAASTSAPVLGLANTGSEKVLVLLLVSGLGLVIIGRKVLA